MGKEWHRNKGKRAFRKDVEKSGKDVFEERRQEGSQHNKEEEWMGGARWERGRDRKKRGRGNRLVYTIKKCFKQDVGFEEVTSFITSVSKDTAGGHTCRNWLYLVMDTGGMSLRLYLLFTG